MHIKTLLNRGERFKSFIYDGFRLTTMNGADALIIDLKNQRGTRFYFRKQVFQDYWMALKKDAEMTKSAATKRFFLATTDFMREITASDGIIDLLLCL